MAIVLIIDTATGADLEGNNLVNVGTLSLNDGLLIGSKEIITTEGFLTNVGLAQNEQTGTSYTPVLSDAGKIIHLTNANEITLTVPPNSSVAYPIGTVIGLFQGGNGAVVVAGDVGVTILSHNDVLTLGGEYAEATLRKIATNTWVLSGNLEFVE